MYTHINGGVFTFIVYIWYSSVIKGMYVYINMYLRYCSNNITLIFATFMFFHNDTLLSVLNLILFYCQGITKFHIEFEYQILPLTLSIMKASP